MSAMRPTLIRTLMPLFALLVATRAIAADEPMDGRVSFLGELLSILIPLLLIIAGLWFGLRMVKRRYGLTGTDAPLSVVQVLPLGPRERLVLIRTRAGRVLAVGVSAQSVNLVADLAQADVDSPSTSDAEAPAPKFSLRSSAPR